MDPSVLYLLSLALGIESLSLSVLFPSTYMLFHPLLRLRTWRTQVWFLKTEREDSNDKQEEVEKQAVVIWAVLAFFTISTALWYAFCCDSELTFKPTWTEWLG
jgi:hypothetical protein